MTNRQITVHRYKCAIMRSNKQQSFDIPEQRFYTKLHKQPATTHKHGFDAQLIQTEIGMTRFLVLLRRNCGLTVTDVEAGHIGLLAAMPVTDTDILALMTLTPTGSVPQPQGDTADYWYKNNQGYQARHHQDRKSLFVFRV